MPARITMKKIREIIRLRFEHNLSYQKIAMSVNLSSSTVQECCNRVRAVNLTWPIEESLDDSALEKMLYKPRINQVAPEDLVIDWDVVRKSLTRKNMTLQLLWELYFEKHPQGVRYSQYCALYRKWCGQLDVEMRQEHKAGEKLFVDYAGITMFVIIDNATGQSRKAEVFVATLGASNYIYTEATWTQNSTDWLSSHKRTFEYLGGVPEILVPDNLRSGVTKANYYDPDLNLAYNDLANFYGIVILPTRVRTPKDKSKVEQAVQHVERRILAKLQEQRFFSLFELNNAIKLLLEELNAKPFQKLPGSRTSEFYAIDKPQLHPLPTNPYTIATWQNIRIARDYHVKIDEHYYSVPYTFFQRKCQLRFTEKVVEVFNNNKRIAAHQRQYTSGKTSLPEHMPKNHRAYNDMTIDSLHEWVNAQSVEIKNFVDRLISESQHEQQALRAGFGLKKLCKDYGVERVTRACQRALTVDAYELRSIKSILKQNLDCMPTSNPTPEEEGNIKHENVRGEEYFS